MAGAVGQGQIQQQNVEMSLPQIFCRFRPALDVGELETFKPALSQGFPQQRGIRWAVFHQQDF